MIQHVVNGGFDGDGSGVFTMEADVEAVHFAARLFVHNEGFGLLLSFSQKENTAPLSRTHP